MRNLTSGFDSIFLGHDPLYNNPLDSALRPMNQSWSTLSIPVLLIAAVIKLFPIFGAVYLLRFGRKKFWLCLGIVMSVFIFYLLLNRSNSAQIFSSTQKGGAVSYGVKVKLTNLDVKHKSRGELYAYIPSIAMLVITMMFFFSTGGHRRQEEVDSYHIDLFTVGAGIYIGTFLLGTVWDYRLMFLLFTVPQLVRWITPDQFRLISVFGLVSVIVSCWITYFDPRIMWLFTIDELANHILFSALI